LLRPQVEAVLPLEQVREALERVAGRRTRGKVVLQIGQQGRLSTYNHRPGKPEEPGGRGTLPRVAGVQVLERREPRRSGGTTVLI
jgi:hypothetical protein